jgi:hypothetical protein
MDILVFTDYDKFCQKLVDAAERQIALVRSEYEHASGF